MELLEAALILLGFATVRIILPAVTLLAVGTWINRLQPYGHQFQ